MKSRYVESDLDGAKTMQNWIYMFFVSVQIFFLFSIQNEFVVRSKTLSSILHGETVI
jgi:hypothetical protein